MKTPSSPETGNLLYSDIEDDLRATVRSLLEQAAPWDAVLARTESDQTTDAALWTSLVQNVGCTALSIPEHYGGAGASWREVAVVAEELGRSVAPVPFLGHTIGLALLHELEEEELLRRCATGEATVAVALPFGSVMTPTNDQISISDGALYGSVATVADTGVADLLIVPVADALYVVSTASEGLSRNAIVSLDMTRPLADLAFDGVAATPVADGPAVGPALKRAWQTGAMLLASEQLGVAEKCLEMTIEYLLIRRQFARVLGSYQALKHRLADLWVLITQAKAAARYAAECAATQSTDFAVAASLAKAHCSEVVQQVAEECIQMHGGIGFTWEHPAHLYLKRAKSTAIALGGPTHHRTVLADLVDLVGADR